MSRYLAAELERARQLSQTLHTERDQLANQQKDHQTLAEQLEEEARFAKSQASELEAQRAQLLGAHEEQQREITRLHEHLQSIAQEAETTALQRDTLAAERDELKQHLDRLETWSRDLENQLRSLEAKLWAPPGHFYSPLVDPRDTHVERWIAHESNRLNEPCPDIDLNEPAMLDWLWTLARHYPRLPFPESPDPAWRYYYNNPAFSHADGIVLACTVLESRPRRVVEVGSGFSSALLMDVAEHLASPSFQLDCFDPYPETARSLLRPNDPFERSIHQLRMQDIPLDVFTALEPGDICFLDTSHISKCQSDVNDYVFRILPALREGVLIHIHDIVYPFEYPARWILEENRSWNEAYIVRALLQARERYQMLLFNDYLLQRHIDEVRRRMPLAAINTGASLWLRKVGNPVRA
jgi:predicted O-methyltransferase YrrM